MTQRPQSFKYLKPELISDFLCVLCVTIFLKNRLDQSNRFGNVILFRPG